MKKQLPDFLYHGEISHDEMVSLFPKHVQEEVAKDEYAEHGTTLVVLASSQKDAEDRIQAKYGFPVAMELAPSGVISFSPCGEAGVMVGMRGNPNPLEMEKCPECRSNHFRPDHTQGNSSCVSCGLSLEWPK